MSDDWHIYRFDTLSSTNDEIRRFCTAENQRIIVQAKQQTAGRGRRGRYWQSLDGNLFFSAALPFALKDLGALVLISSLAVLQTVRALAPAADVKLKWPNDVLLNGAKVCGILLEKGPDDYMIVGIGVNVAQSPNSTQMLYPTTSLAQAGINTDADAFLQRFLPIFDALLTQFAQTGFSEICRAWLDNAAALNQPIIVKQEKSVQRGLFKGLDEAGRLLLEYNNQTAAISVGDIFFDKEEKDE